MLIAGPNLTIDRTIRLGELRVGEVVRAEHATVTPGGKGLNVARAAGALGGHGELVGFVPGRTGAAVASMIADEGVALRAVPCDGEVRSAAVMLEASGRTTVVNEPGPQLGAGDWERYEAEVESALQRRPTALVCSGSCPPGAPSSAYRRLVRRAHAHGVASVVDAAGALLAESLAAEPSVVSPNLAEAEAVLDGREGERLEAGADAAERALRAARDLHARGAATAVVTAADAGVAVVAAHAAWWVPAVRVTVRNVIGAGDAFLAAFTMALTGGSALPTAVRRAVATAAASVECAVGGMVDADRARELEAAVPEAQPG